MLTLHLTLVHYPPVTTLLAQRDKRMQLSWACEEQLFKQEMENADDIRLSVRLFAKCMPDKRKVRNTASRAGRCVLGSGACVGLGIREAR